MELIRTDIVILRILEECKADKKSNSASLAEIKECDVGVGTWSLRQHLKSLVSAGYIAEGYMDHCSKTYYITTRGLEVIHN